MSTSIFITSLVGLALASISHATGIPDYPFDVEEFVDRREICDHFRGEEPYDDDRAKFLAEQIEKVCTGTDKELQALKQKYNGDDEIMQILNRFEERVESTVDN
jgi:hypothetical protein